MLIDRAILGFLDDALALVRRALDRLGPTLDPGRRRLAASLLLGAWFFMVFPTEPLYVENQNTKFLHGMAAAGIGHLDRDWTANTVDVMPVFTGITYLLHVARPPIVIYLVQILLFAVFLHAVLRIAGFAAGRRADHTLFPIITGILVVVSQFSNGGARVWGGVAKQYLLGPALEPQSFGVFFLLAVVWFLSRRTEAALWLSTIPAIIHPGYVVPAGALISAFAVTSFIKSDPTGRPRPMMVLASLLTASSSLVYLGLMILPTDGESWRAANEILAKTRIPSHAVPTYWFDFDAGAKIIGLLAALWLAWRHAKDLFWIITVGFGIAFSLTALATLIDSNELGMISPWRISVYLIPLGLAVLVGRLVAWSLDQQEKRCLPKLFSTIGWALALLTLAVTIRGISGTTTLYRSAALPPHIAFMRETGDAQTLYLTNPLDMNIRLQSGLPQLVSWKTHPYKDVEVLEWYRRYLLAERVFKGNNVNCTALDEAIETYGVTHLLLDDPEKMMSCSGAIPLFADKKTRIYRLSR